MKKKKQILRINCVCSLSFQSSTSSFTDVSVIVNVTMKIIEENMNRIINSSPKIFKKNCLIYFEIDSNKSLTNM